LLGRTEVLATLLRGDGRRGFGPRRAGAALLDAVLGSRRRAFRWIRSIVGAGASALATLAIAAGYVVAVGVGSLWERWARIRRDAAARARDEVT